MADNHGHGGHGAGHDEFMVDEEQPANGQLVIWGLVTALVFFGAGGVLTSIFYKYSDHVIEEKVLSRTAPEVAALRAEEDAKLHCSAPADKSKPGATCTPIEDAMKKVVEEAKK